MMSVYEHTYSPQGWLAEKLADKPGPQILALAADYAARPDVMLGQDDPYYAMFMAQVDRRLRLMVGLTHRDLVDYLTYDAYQAGDSPREVARAILENDEIGAEMLEALEMDE